MRITNLFKIYYPYIIKRGKLSDGFEVISR